ncbi:hypothetical protein ACP4OV_012922 [Aristida adscensionis]
MVLLIMSAVTAMPSSGIRSVVRKLLITLLAQLSIPCVVSFLNLMGLLDARSFLGIAFTFMGAKIDHAINRAAGPYVFKINGQVYHRIGSLLPPEGEPPQFAELYIYDTDHEIDNRMRALDPSERLDDDLDRDIIGGLLHMLDQHNPLVQKFRMARDRIAEGETENVGTRIVGAREALMVLQYPLLFPYGEQGYQVGVTYSGVQPEPYVLHADGRKVKPHVKVTMQDYYRYMFHYRRNQPNPYLCCGCLSSQAKVDARACIHQDRLDYVINNQPKLRADYFQGLVDTVAGGATDAESVGKRTYLPASHTGGRRYMLQNYHDAVAIARVHGPSDIFLTFTSNPKWPEVTEFLRFEPGQKYTDRADAVVRVYNMKLEELLGDIKNGSVFGPTNAALHSIES